MKREGNKGEPRGVVCGRSVSGYTLSNIISGELSIGRSNGRTAQYMNQVSGVRGSPEDAPMDVTFLDVLRTIWMNEDHVSSDFTSSPQSRGSEQKEDRKISYKMQFPIEVLGYTHAKGRSGHAE